MVSISNECITAASVAVAAVACVLLLLLRCVYDAHTVCNMNEMNKIYLHLIVNTYGFCFIFSWFVFSLCVISSFSV